MVENNELNIKEELKKLCSNNLNLYIKFKQLQKIGYKLFEQYTKLNEIELEEGIENTNYKEILNLVEILEEIEEQEYNKLSLEEIEEFINLVNIRIIDASDVDFSVICLFRENQIADDMIFRRMWHKLYLQYIKKNNYNENYLNDIDENISVSYKTRTFDIGKTVYVFDRIGTFEMIKQNIFAETDARYLCELQNYIDEFNDLKKYLLTIKYNTLYFNTLTSNKYFENIGNYQSTSEINNEVYSYLEKYVNTTSLLSLVETIQEQYNDDEIDSDFSDFLDFLLSLIYVKISAEKSDPQIVNNLIIDLNGNNSKSKQKIIGEIKRKMKIKRKET